jgi:hypothetical protein
MKMKDKGLSMVLFIVVLTLMMSSCGGSAPNINSAPVIQKVSEEPTGTIAQDHVTFEWTGTDPAGERSITKYRYKKDSEDWTDNNPLTGTSYEWTGFSEGEHTFQVKAIDNEGLDSNIITWNFKKEKILEITVVADSEDMSNGQFHVHFHEEVNNPLERVFRFEYFFYANKNSLADYITPVNAAGFSQANINNEDYTITYNVASEGQVKYGYTVTPQPVTEGTVGTGYCDENIAVWDIITTLPVLNPEEKGWDKVVITFDIPSEMSLYVPWEPINEEEKVYQLYPAIQYEGYVPENRFWLASWGQYDSVYETNDGWGDIAVLGYQEDITIVKELILEMFDHLKGAFRENLELIPKKSIFVLFPEGWDYYTTSEGIGGYYLPNTNGQQTEAIPGTNEYIFENYPYIAINDNLNGLSISGGHCLTHTLFTNTNLWDWWAVEGIAVYHQIYLFKLTEWLTNDEYENEWKQHINFYWEEVVGKGNDHILDGIGVEYSVNDPAIQKWMVCFKGSIVFYIFDEIIKDTKGEEKSLVDFFNYYFNRAFENENRWGLHFDDQYFIDALAEYTGKDIQQFFDKYVYDMQPLPIKVENDTIVVEY